MIRYIQITNCMFQSIASHFFKPLKTRKHNIHSNAWSATNDTHQRTPCKRDKSKNFNSLKNRTFLFHSARTCRSSLCVCVYSIYIFIYIIVGLSSWLSTTTLPFKGMEEARVSTGRGASLIAAVVAGPHHHSIRPAPATHWGHTGAALGSTPALSHPTRYM